MGSASYLRELVKSVSWTCVIAVTAIIISILSVEFSAHWAEKVDDRYGMFLMILWFLCPIITLLSTVICLAISFRKMPRNILLGNIIFSYIVIVVVFAGLYYSFSTFGDYQDAYRSYRYYRSQGEHLFERRIKEVLRRRVSDRAFNGINCRLWSSVEDHYPPFVSKDSSELPIDHLINAAKLPENQVVKFAPNNKFAVALDCFHFSVVTIATLGYGDITPNKWYSKLSSDLEVLTGIILFILALGMLFGDWWGEKKKSCCV